MTTETPAYQYECTRGHLVQGPGPSTRCPVVARGVPCPGELVRFGPGSKGGKA